MINEIKNNIEMKLVESPLTTGLGLDIMICGEYNAHILELLSKGDGDKIPIIKELFDELKKMKGQEAENILKYLIVIAVEWIIASIEDTKRTILGHVISELPDGELKNTITEAIDKFNGK